MKAVVFGGASFIGSHLIDRLLADEHSVVCVDDFSSGSWLNIKDAREHKNFKILTIDLRTASVCRIARALHNVDLVYDLAADHGGRGYVQLHQINCSNNFAIDNNVFQACILAKVPKIIYASSGCVYPIDKQTDTSHITMLKEEDLGPPYNPDGLYGLAKLVGELTLERMYQEYGIQSVSCRFFTVYGPRAKENHAILSFIARAFVQQDPFVFWGDGTAIRNWTYVDDIIEGLILAQDISGCTSLNLGTMEHQTVTNAINKVLTVAQGLWYPSYAPMLIADTTMPVGPLCRVADNAKYLSLGGKPSTPFAIGLIDTMGWYSITHDIKTVAKNFDRLLIARK